MSTHTPAEVERIALGYLRTPFRARHRRKGVGVDCSGLIVCVARELGITVRDDLDYDRDFGTALAAGLIEVPLAARQVGDVLLFRVFVPAGRCRKEYDLHAGIQTSRGFVHADNGVGCVVNVTLAGKWERRLVRAFRFPGVCGEVA